MPSVTRISPSRLSLILLLLLPHALHAQSLITLTPQQCEWHAGDNPAWAAPSFDDSAWQPYASWKIDDHTPHMWVRCHTSLTPLRTLAHPALQVHLDAASAVYLNGVLLASSGNLASGQFSLAGFYTVPLPSASLESPAIIALHIVVRDPLTQSDPGAIFLGDQQALQDHRAAAALSGMFGYLPVGLCFSLIGVVGFM
ncbi:MAG: hypothetical protein WA414_13210, partial [Acidobacteriaceae bacterium]